VTDDEKTAGTPNPDETNPTAPAKIAKEEQYADLPASIREYVEKSGLPVKDADVYAPAKKRSDATEALSFEDALAQEYAKKIGR
jgi:hypothetical protein